MSTATPARTVTTRELTIRGVILGGVITLVFTAANVYLGLKVGLTFATSIPAAVISMAVLRRFRGSTVPENNIIQTVASAAGARACRAENETWATKRRPRRVSSARRPARR